MKQTLLISCLAIGLAAASACNNGTNSGDSVDSTQAINDSTKVVGSDANDFMTEAADGGMMEVQLGQMAQQKAVNQRVKNFGKMMVSDHSKANDELKQIAQQKGVAVPATLSEKHQKDVDDLGKKTGTEFDKAYMSMMVSDHKDDIDDFKKAANDVNDSAIKGFAAKTLPTLQMHLDSAQAINDILK